MKHKAFFIMIIILLAALRGVAQKDFVVIEGAEQSYFVEDHPGSNYSWSLLIDLDPDIEANPADCYFTTSNGSHQISVQWNKIGLYYLNVLETDIKGCTNRKVLAVNVVSNNRSIAFNSSSGLACYHKEDNGFSLPVQILGDGGVQMDETAYPVDITFTVNGISNSQQVEYAHQILSIDKTWFSADPGQESVVTVQLTTAQDRNGTNIPVVSGSDIYNHTITAIPQIEFINNQSDKYQDETGEYEVGIITGKTENAQYNWIVDPPEGTSTDLSSINSADAQILWDGPVGRYEVKVWVTDGNGCISDTINTEVEVQESDPIPIPVYAGPDTVIGGCVPYRFNKVFPDNNNYTYLWQPAQYLNDPTIANPVFTPGETTTYRLTVTTLPGYSYSDTVTITVSEVMASAGEDFMLENETTAILNGSGSSGVQIQYSWTTENGTFVDGTQTASPVISSPGTYYLTVTDLYGCVSTDSVLVGRFISAPIATNDYDTTDYQKLVTIDLLSNDEDQQGELDVLSMQILQYPSNGIVDINGDGTVTYTPNNGFLGRDVFQYTICNYNEKCDNAYVYVYVMAGEFFIPEAFTPNGDNINDYFEIKGIELFRQNSITIINRWGKTVYKAQGYGISTTPQFWNGKSNQGGGNADLPSGTYFYVLDLGNGEQAIAGSVYIDR